jgi:thiol-disulfide isomerase/thioredoxin
MKRFFLVLAFCLPVLSTLPAVAEMRSFVRGSWQDVLDSNAAVPTVVHFWGLTCAPCLAELPHWARLRQERPAMNIIMIAADPAPADTEDLTATLQQAGLGDLESWAFADSFSERLRFEIDPKWRGEMPRTLLLDRDGKITAMSGVADLDFIRNWFDRAATGQR